jgi:hypothetical protein
VPGPGEGPARADGDESLSFSPPFQEDEGDAAGELLVPEPLGDAAGEPLAPEPPGAGDDPAELLGLVVGALLAPTLGLAPAPLGRAVAPDVPAGVVLQAARAARTASVARVRLIMSYLFLREWPPGGGR